MRWWIRLADAHLGLLLAGLNIGLGLVLVLGGPLRTSNAAFDTARAVAPIHVWGAGFLLCGLLSWAVINKPHAGQWLLVLGGSLYTFWGTAFILSALHSATAGLTGIVVYLWLALLHLLAGTGMAHEARRINHEGLSEQRTL